MYSFRNALLHGLLFASLLFVPAVGFGLGTGGSSGVGGKTGGGTSGNGVGTENFSGGTTQKSLTPDNKTGSFTLDRKTTQPHLNTSSDHRDVKKNLHEDEDLNGTSGQTGMSTGGLAMIYYGSPYTYRPYYYYYPYRPYFYHSYSYPYRPYYYHYGW